MAGNDEYASMWEGNSPIASHAYRRMQEAGEAPDNSWLERLFGRGRASNASQRITQQPLPPLAVPDSPFGGSPVAPQARPASKITSAGAIADRVSRMIAAANEPPPVSPADFEMPPSDFFRVADPLATAVNSHSAEEPPVPRVPVDMTQTAESQNPFVASTLPAEIGQAIATFLSGGNRFGGNTFGGNTFGGNRFGGNEFGGARYGASAGRDPGETGGSPDMTNFQQNQTVWDLLKNGGNRFGGNKFGGSQFGGNTFGGARFGASANPPIKLSAGAGRSRSGELPPYDLPYLYRAGGGSIPGYAAGGLPEMVGLPKQVVQNNPQTALPPPVPIAPMPSESGGGGGDGGAAGGFGAIMQLLPLLALQKGGNVPGFMRGGYPELYNAPVRHFDSGGENYVTGYGDSDGRADDVSARLSPKEYVVDAETMSMLGDGNPDNGAKKMDQFRANVRKHKGKALAKGKFSPNAKNPMEYLVGNPLGDGLRRLGKNK